MTNTTAAKPKTVFTSAEEKAIRDHVAHFKKYLASDQHAGDLAAREKRCHFFQQQFPKRLTELSEADVVELVTHLWATQMWGNKQYLAQQIVAKNGLQVLGAQLKKLWNQTTPIASRYDEFLANIYHLGPAALTELLCYIEPARCGIWNQVARQALEALRIDRVDPKTYRITGAQYEKFNEVLAAIAVELGRAGIPDLDLFQVDLFLWVVVTHDPQSVVAAQQVSSTHDEIRDLVAGIGAMLGFESETEVTIAAGARVDAVWRSRIGNLGTVTYVFEVQSGGSIDSLILNLQKAKSNPTVQKVIAVSDDGQLAKIEKETDGLPSEFTKALSLWKFSDVHAVSKNLQEAIKIIEQLGLVPTKD